MFLKNILLNLWKVKKNMNYKELLNNNLKIEYLEWNQYNDIHGNFNIDNVNISGDFNEKELEICSNDISDFLDNYDMLIDTFGNNVKIKIKSDESIEICEI